MSTAVLSVLPLKLGWLQDAARPFTLLGIAGLATIIILPFTEGLCMRLVNMLPLPERILAKLKLLVGHVLRGIRSFHDPRRMVVFLFLTAVIWCLDAVTVATVSTGLGLPLTLQAAFLLIAALGLGSALPSTPGYVGVYQFIAVAVLTPFGFLRDDAIAFILVYQALQYAVYGLWGLLAIGLNRGSTQPQASTTASASLK
jgi:uncharacterized membrane protein YbhN (UPF0104 family)